MNIKEMKIVEDIQATDFEPILTRAVQVDVAAGRIDDPRFNWSTIKYNANKAWKKSGNKLDTDSIRNILKNATKLSDEAIDDALTDYEVRTTKSGTGSIPKGATFKHTDVSYMWDGTQWAGKTDSGEWRKTDPTSTDPILKASDDEMYERYVEAAKASEITKPDGTPMRVPAPTEPVSSKPDSPFADDMEMQELAKTITNSGMVLAVPGESAQIPNNDLRELLNDNKKSFVFENDNPSALEATKEQKTNMENEMRVNEMCGSGCGDEMEMPKTNYNLSVTKDEGSTHKTMTVTSDQPDELIRVLQLSGMDTGHSEPDGDEIAGVDMDHDEPSPVSSMKDLISKVSHPPVGHDEAVEEVEDVEQDHSSDAKTFGLKDLVVGLSKKQPRQRRVAGGDNPYKNAGQLEEDYTAAYDKYKTE